MGREAAGRGSRKARLSQGEAGRWGASLAQVLSGQACDKSPLRMLVLPQVDDVHPFYGDLMNVLYDKVRPPFV